MPLEEGLVDRDVFDADDALLPFHLDDPVHQQEGIAVRRTSMMRPMSSWALRTLRRTGQGPRQGDVAAWLGRVATMCARTRPPVSTRSPGCRPPCDERTRRASAARPRWRDPARPARSRWRSKLLDQPLAWSAVTSLVNPKVRAVRAPRERLWVTVKLPAWRPIRDAATRWSR